MKLLLSDGTAVSVKSYEKTNTTVNGNTVDAVSVMVQKTTLEKVKTLFGDSTNLETMHLYNDENILIETFNGYQIRKSIALGDDDTSFVVLLAKSSEVNEQLEAMSKDIATIANSVKELQSAVATIASTAETANTNADDAIKKYNEQVKVLDSIKETVNTSSESVSDQATAIANLEIAVNKVKESFNSFAETATTISNQYTSMTDAVNSITSSISSVYTKIDDAHKVITAKADEFNHINNLVDEVKELATSNDENVIKYGQSMEVLTEGFNQAKLDVEHFSEKMTTFTKQITEVSDTVTTANETAEKAVKDITELSSTVTAVEGKTDTVEKAATELEERVSNLEPVTDYTTLSLDEAKQYRINESKLALATYLEEHPITSSCHGGTAEQYSITSEKQNFLQAMITMTTMAQASGLEYQPSWNQVGESCTYDWTLTELQQLAIEIEAVVRPLVSHQQALEKQILNVKSMTALQAVSISYENIKPNDIVMKDTTSEDETDTETASAKSSK